MPTPPQTTPEDKRPYTASAFCLELDKNKQPGFLKSIEGADIKADVMTYQVGQNMDLMRQIGFPKYGDIKLTCGMSFSDEFYDWIAEFFRGNAVRHSGAICAADFHFDERARREFFEAMITEFSWPKLDANDKNAAFITVTLACERIRFAAGSGQPLGVATSFQGEKLWSACNFEFEIKGFEEACYQVTKIDQFAIKMKPIEYRDGGHRDALKLPGRVEFPNLAFYLPEVAAGPFFDHIKTRVIDGTPAPDARLTGVITVQDNSGADLCQIDLSGVDINAVTPDKSDASSEEVKQVKVDVVCEKMAFTYMGGTT